MRLRCARCGCYVQATPAELYTSWAWEDAKVQPCARCLREAQQQAIRASGVAVEIIKLQGASMLTRKVIDWYRENKNSTE